jgi:hypothetical protein
MNPVRKVTPPRIAAESPGHRLRSPAEAHERRDNALQGGPEQREDEARESTFRLSGCDAPSKPARSGQYRVR